MTRRINAAGLLHIQKWEGKRLTAYQDMAGIWTIGYGHTSAAGAPKVVAGMKINDQEADRILRADLAKFEKRVSDLVKVPLNDNQYAALVSFDFNTGALHKSTLLKKLNTGDYSAVPAELMKWVNAGGKRVQGLVNRRAAEAGLWVKGDFVSSNYVSPEQKKDTLLKPELIASAGGLLSGLGGMAAGSSPIQWALAIIMVGAFGIGVYFLIKRMQEQSA
ncbi:lysozyme [Paenochrobactrum sp. BZR 588]|uniref:lysozyme n=1 Tax=unclassified Paenochrobactrum TaxID=2639760 RepID=UPI003853DC08